MPGENLAALSNMKLLTGRLKIKTTPLIHTTQNILKDVYKNDATVRIYTKAVKFSMARE